MLAVNEQGIRKNVVFKNSAYGASHWFPPITYDGTDLVSSRNHHYPSYLHYVFVSVSDCPLIFPAVVKSGRIPLQ